MRVFMKSMNPALWICFSVGVILFIVFAICYFRSDTAKDRSIFSAALIKQSIMFFGMWGLIWWSMCDSEKIKLETKREIERYAADIKALRIQK